MGLNYQYIIRMDNDGNSTAAVTSLSGGEFQNGLTEYYLTSAQGKPVKKFISSGHSWTPIKLTISLGESSKESAKLWLKWISASNTEGTQTPPLKTLTIDFLEDDGKGKKEVLMSWYIQGAVLNGWSLNGVGVGSSTDVLKVNLNIDFQDIDLTIKDY